MCDCLFEVASPGAPGATMTKPAKQPRRKPSAYQKAYAAAFKRVAPRFKKKDGSWRKGGFAAAGRAARREPSVRKVKKK